MSTEGALPAALTEADALFHQRGPLLPRRVDHRYANSKTESVQDLVGIIAAIGFGFALLTLIAGDQVHFTASATAQTSDAVASNHNVLASWANFFHLPGPGATAAHSFTNFLLLCVITWRFYFVNCRYLANRYGVRGQDSRDWTRFLYVDVPAIMAEGLVFAAAGLLVNNAILFLLFLGLGLAIDAFAWNLCCNLILARLWEASRWCENHRDASRTAASKARWSLANNGVVASCIAAMAWRAHSMPDRAYFDLGWPIYWVLVALVIGNCFLSWLVYNKDYATEAGF